MPDRVVLGTQAFLAPIPEETHIELANHSSQSSLVRFRAGEGEPLVLLHGVGESAAGWRPVQEALSQRFDVIALDFPGFGQAPAFPDQILPTASAFADAVEKQMDLLGIQRFHVAGYSLGGRVALELAGRGRILSVIAIAPDGLGTPLERVYQAVALMTGRLVSKVLAPVSRPLMATGPGRSLFFMMERSKPWRLSAPDARELLQNFARSTGYEATVLATMVDVPQRLNRIECPVLLLQGTLDPLVSMQSPRFLAFIPHARMRWLPGLSHVPISDDPALISRLMLDHLDAVTTEPLSLLAVANA